MLLWLIVNRIETHTHTRACIHIRLYLLIYSHMTVCLPTVRLSLCLSAGICVGMYLRLSQIELLSISEDSEDTWDSETTVTCKGRNSHWRRFVCAETFVDLDTVARWRYGRTFLNVIMHIVRVHYTTPGRQEGLHVSHISMQLASSWSVISPVAQNGKPKHRHVSSVTRKETRVAGIHSKSSDICALRAACRESRFVKQRFTVLAVS